MAIKFLASGDAQLFIDALQKFSDSEKIELAVCKALAQGVLLLLVGAYQNALTDAQLSEDLTSLGISIFPCSLG